MSNGIPLKQDSQRRIVPSDRLFSPINDLLIIISAIGLASSLMADAGAHKTEKTAMRVKTRWPDLAFALPLGGALRHAVHGLIPTGIEIGILTDQTEIAKPLPDAKLKTEGLHNVMGHVVSPIFLMFFERYNNWLTANHGDAVNWPPTLNFARVVRNACSHGEIHIRNPGAPPVTWRGMSIGPADNGSKLIGSQLKLGEILALMFDADDALDAMGTPVI